MKTNNENPFWMSRLDAMIQRSKGSTKRQLQSLKEQQLAKHENPTQIDPITDILREALRILTSTHLQIEETNIVARIKTILGIESEPRQWIENRLLEAQTKSDNEDFQQTLNQ